MQDHNAPINPLPAVVWALVLPLIAIEVVLGLGEAGIIGGQEAIGWRLQAIQRFAFVPDAMWWMIENRRFPPVELARIVLYPVINASVTNALFGGVMLLAIGKIVGEVFRWWAVLAVVFAGIVVAALAFMLLPTSGLPLFGTFPAVYGLIGAFTYILWRRGQAVGAHRFAAFRMIGFLLAVQPVFALVSWALMPSNPFQIYVLWIWLAEMAAFAAGFLLSFAVAPGGWQMLMARLRNR